VTVDRSIGPRCNIGPEEIARRRRSAMVASLATVLVAVSLVALHVPGPARLLIWPLAAAAAVTWLQVTHRFCVAFGALGLQNFGRLGEQTHVDPQVRAADRRRAFQIVLEGALIGLVVALALAVTPA
jgi:predicted nucleic acid-binding Zn ribbon protein